MALQENNFLTKENCPAPEPGGIWAAARVCAYLCKEAKKN